MHHEFPRTLCPEGLRTCVNPSLGLSFDEAMADLDSRITTNPNQCGGRPCVRGMRIRVSDVLDLLATGMSIEGVIEELPDLEREDVLACLRFASRSVNHAILAA